VDPKSEELDWDALDWILRNFCAILKAVAVARLQMGGSFSDAQAEKNRVIEQANAAYAAGDYDQAITQFDRALQLDSEDSNIWYSLGLTFSKKQQYYPAIHAYNEALRLNPDLYLAQLSKAHCYALQEQDDLTLVALKKAIRLGGDGALAAVAADPLFERIRARLSAKLEDESMDPIDDLIDLDD
jgi:tetratricopeptide (TPR) repeat protein